MAQKSHYVIDNSFSNKARTITKLDKLLIAQHKSNVMIWHFKVQISPKINF